MLHKIQCTQRNMKRYTISIIRRGSKSNTDDKRNIAMAINLSIRMTTDSYSNGNRYILKYIAKLRRVKRKWWGEVDESRRGFPPATNEWMILSNGCKRREKFWPNIYIFLFRSWTFRRFEMNVSLENFFTGHQSFIDRVHLVYHAPCHVKVGIDRLIEVGSLDTFGIIWRCLVMVSVGGWVCGCALGVVCPGVAQRWL